MKKNYYAAEYAYGVRTLAPISLHVFASREERDEFVADDDLHNEAITASEARHASTRGGCGIVDATIHARPGAHGIYNRALLAPSWLRALMRAKGYYLMSVSDAHACYSC